MNETFVLLDDWDDHISIVGVFKSFNGAVIAGLKDNHKVGAFVKSASTTPDRWTAEYPMGRLIIEKHEVQA